MVAHSSVVPDAKRRVRLSSCPLVCLELFFRGAMRLEKVDAMDEDLKQMSREQLIEAVISLRAGIRRHRDSTGLKQKD